MAKIKVRNVSPLGELQVPILGGRIVAAGEELDVAADVAGHVPVDDAPGHGLLGQVGVWEPVIATKATEGGER